MGSNKSVLQFPNKKQFIITVPKGLVLAKNWKQGDTIEFTFDDKGNLVMRKVGERKRLITNQPVSERKRADLIGENSEKNVAEE